MTFSDDAINKISAAIFEIPGVQVLEAYSEYDKEPKIFGSAQDFSAYAKKQLSTPRGLAFVFVIYPDMAGSAVQKAIYLDRNKFPNHSVRYTWEGWGLISIQLASPDAGISSSINANTEKRALMWAPTHPDFDPPSTWDWAAILRHKRRLQRVLKKVA